MHTISLLSSAMFDVAIDGAGAGLGDVFPGWHLHDRVGLVIDEPLGGLGASHLVHVAIALFYDAAERRRGALTVYPEIFAFHVGRGWGSHAAFDFWPARREVILSDDPCDLLDAINDRGITRLVVPDRPGGTPNFRPKEYDTALDRVQSAFVYDVAGRMPGGNLSIAGNDPRTEVNPQRVLRPVYLDAPKTMAKPFKESDSAYIAWLKLRATDITEAERAVAMRRRVALRADGLVTETYRRVSVEEGLCRIAGIRDATLRLPASR